MKRLPITDGAAWVALSALLCVGAIVVTMIAGGGILALDWQPALGLREPWRLWTCAWVHGSLAHLIVNVAGGAVVGFVGWRARLPTAAAVAWFVAWPGTQLVMASIPRERLAAVMPHYFGLSGVLHAGVVVLGLSLAWPAAASRSRARLAPQAGARVDEAPDAPPPQHVDVRPARERWIGAAIVAGTLGKVVSEAPWDLAPRDSAALGIAVAPVAHACGLAAGALAWGAMHLLTRPPARRGR